MDPRKKRAIELAQIIADHNKFHRLESYIPYPKQLEFHHATGREDESLFQGANQSGKTLCTTANDAIHLTGLYPDPTKSFTPQFCYIPAEEQDDDPHSFKVVAVPWVWEGKRFDGPVHWWVLGESGESTRDIVQASLFGGQPDTDDWGTGWLPLDALGKPKMSRNTSGLIDYCDVKHYTGEVDEDGKLVSDGWSRVWMKTYGKGRERLAGKPLHGVHPDEEPGDDVYGELLPRVNAADGIISIGFTAMKGYSKVVTRFHEPGDTVVPRSVIKMGILDVPDKPEGHYTPAQKRKIIDKYLPHERAARAHGDVYAGIGMVFPFTQERIGIEPFDIPEWWPKIRGLDIGFSDHPTAVADVAINNQVTPNVIYVYRGWRETEPSFANVVSANPGKMPVAWPADAGQRVRDGRGSEQRVAKMFHEEGFNMIGAGEKGYHAQFIDEGTGVEAGLLIMYNMFLAGQLKIFTTVLQWWDEMDTYHREMPKDKGGKPVGMPQVVKTKDDFICAVRYAIMMQRFAEAAEAAPRRRDAYREEIRKRKTRGLSWMAA